MQSFESVLLNLIIWLPLAGAVLIGLFAGDDARRPRWLAAVFSGLPLLLAVWLLFRYDPALGGFQFVTQASWIPAFNVQYAVGLDGISLPLVVLNALLTFLAVLISWNVGLRPTLYFPLLLIVGTAVAGVFSSLDFFLFFLFWELELIPMYLLIGIWGSARREYAALKFIIYTVVGSAFMLVGILGLYFASQANTFMIPELMPAMRGAAEGTQIILFIALLIGFAVKVPIWPLHTWLPDAHTEAPTAGSVILAGVLLKMGGYGLIRIVQVLPAAAQALALGLAVLAIINVVYGAYMALAQSDLKRLIANSSVSHMGYVLLGLAALTQVGLQGAVLQMVSHGLITGLLFMMVGLVYDRTHTRQIAEMGGLAPRMPVIATVFTFAALASLGLPSLAGFVAEFQVFIGAYPVWPELTIVGTFVIVLTAGYLLWMIQRVFQGPLPERWSGLGDATRLETATIGALVFVIALIGVYPNLLLNVIAVGVGPIAGLFRPV